MDVTPFGSAILSDPRQTAGSGTGEPGRTANPSSAFPNPFRSGTTFQFTTRGGGGLDTASLTVCDLLGNRIAALFRTAGTEGTQKIEWDGMNEAGEPAASGIYMCRLRLGAETRCIKVTRLR
jgi:hypothetical protein